MQKVAVEQNLMFGQGKLTTEDFFNLRNPDYFQIDQRCFDRGICTDGIQIVPSNHRVLLSTSLAILDADETQLADTLEHFHDGTNGRFARAVIKTLSQCGVTISPEQLDHEGFWGRARKELSGQTEEQWLAGLAEKVSRRFAVQIHERALETAMEEVLSPEEVKLFALQVKPVEMIRELSSALAGQGVPRHLCTTTKEHIIRPLLDYYGLIEGFEHVEFGAEKKLKDSNAPGGQVFKGLAVESCLSKAGVQPRAAVMFGDSIADWGTAAVADVRTVVLRPANFLVEKHQGYEGAALELKQQIDDSIRHNPGLAQTKTLIVSGFDNVMVMPMRTNPSNQARRPAIAWTGEIKNGW